MLGNSPEPTEERSCQFHLCYPYCSEQDGGPPRRTGSRKQHFQERSSTRSPMNRLKFVTILVTLVFLASVPASAQRGRGRGRGAAPPQAMQDVANGIVEAINSHDEDALMAMLAEGAFSWMKTGMHCRLPHESAGSPARVRVSRSRACAARSGRTPAGFRSTMNSCRYSRGTR